MSAVETSEPTQVQVETVRAALRDLLSTVLPDSVRIDLNQALTVLNRLVASLDPRDHLPVLVDSADDTVSVNCSCGEVTSNRAYFLLHLERLGIVASAQLHSLPRYADGPYAGMTRMDAVRAKAAVQPPEAGS